jgi:hypothetical protein
MAMASAALQGLWIYRAKVGSYLCQYGWFELCLPCLMMKSGRAENLLSVLTKYTVWDFVDWTK